jgi:hypothetical protein
MIRLNLAYLFLTLFASLCIGKVATASTNFDIEEFYKKNQISKYAEINFTDSGEVVPVIVMHSSTRDIPVNMMIVFKTDACVASLYHDNGVGSAAYKCESGANMRATYQCQRESCLLKGTHQKRGKWSFLLKYYDEKIPTSEVIAFSKLQENVPSNNTAFTELYAEAGKCDLSAIECLNIGGYGIIISSAPPSAPYTLHLFALKETLFSCPDGYSHFDQANMIAEPFHISVCGEANELAIQNNLTSKNRLQIFKSRVCSQDAELVLSTSQIVVCTNTTAVDNLSVSPSKLNKAKSTCTELGFTLGTEKHGDCVLKMMDN